jgi:uncharacterized protein (DUF1501 family)
MRTIPIHTRRQFLSTGLGIVGAGAALPNFLLRSALAGERAVSDQRIVVALLLTGGPDGLSVVPPYADDAYYRERPKLALQPDKIIKLTDKAGLHPNLPAFKSLFDAGQMAVIQGMGYPNFDLSHFESRDIWQACARRKNTGWLGRYLDLTFPDETSPTLNVAVGPDRFPLILQGQRHPGVGFASPASFRYAALTDQAGQAAYRQMNDFALARSAGDLQFISRTAVNANTASQQLSAIAGNYQTPQTYPDTEFGNAVRTIAALINGKMNTRAYFAAQGIAQFGGFDTHADQPRRLDMLLTELNDTVGAFYQDLARCGNAERVLTFTFSEFGRRVQENFSQGTDHGQAQPMFLFGPMVKPGVHGIQPSLTDLDIPKGLENGGGNLKMQVDFRCVYAAILEKWLGVPSEPVLGGQYAAVECLA